MDETQENNLTADISVDVGDDDDVVARGDPIIDASQASIILPVPEADSDKTLADNNIVAADFEEDDDTKPIKSPMTKNLEVEDAKERISSED